VPHAIVPTELLNEEGERIDPALAQAQALRLTAEKALIAGQILAHVALMAMMLDKIPLVQQALGTPAGFRPGQDSPEDHLRAGLGVALMIGGSEVGRVAMGGVGMALMQTLKGATLRRAQPQVREVEELPLQQIAVHVPAIDAAPAPAVSHWEQASQALDQAGHRIGLGADARGRMASYAPILNLTVDALTTGPHSGLIQGLARSLDQPLFDVAIAVSNFTMSLLNAADMLLLARQTGPDGGAPVPDEPVSNYGSVSESPPLHREPSANSSTEDSELNEVVMYYAGKPSPTRHAPVASHDSQIS
jgi:hypothetical protein